jgi:hypothetical protein
MTRSAYFATFWAAGSLAPFGLGSCAFRGAPSFVAFGAYFPGWLLCAIVGIVAASLARGIFVATGLAERLPYQFFVCLSIGVGGAALFWITGFSR